MTDRAQANLERLSLCFEAIGRGDVDALVAHYTEDYVLELPFAVSPPGAESGAETVAGEPRPIRRIEGREAVRTYLRGALERFRFALRLDVVHPSADPDLLIVEYHARGEHRPSGGAYANRYVGFWWFRDERVRRTREYYDPRAAAEAIAAANRA